MTKVRCLLRATGALIALALAPVPAASAQLLVGVESFADEPTFEGVYVYDLARGTRRLLFVPADEPAFAAADGVAGMAADDDAGVIYMVSGDNLFAASYDPADPFAPLSVEKLGDLRNPETNTISHAVTGLAFANGNLYAVDAQFSAGFPTPEGIYRVDPAALTTTLVVDLTSVSDLLDPGGFAFNPATNLFYITSDDADGIGGAGRGLYSVDVFDTLGGGVGAVAFVTGYPTTPGTSNDVDGLAIGDNKAFFVHDGPGQFGVWDFALGAFAAPIQTPWIIGHEFSGGAWAPSLAPAPRDHDLVITMTDSADPFYALNAPLTYTVTVTNDSLVPTSNVVVSTTLDTTTTFFSTTGGGTHNGGVVITNLGTLAPLATASFDIVVLSTIQTTALASSTVAGTQVDPDLTNNTASEETLIVLDADLETTIVATPNPIVGAGSSNITYHVTVTNNGPLAANDVDVNVFLDPGTTFVSASAGSLMNGVLVASFPTINDGQTVSFDVIASPTSTGRFTASVDAVINGGPSADPDLDNNFRMFTSAVVDALPHAVAEVIYSTIATHDSSLVPGGRPGERFSDFDRPYRSPDGSRWIMGAFTDTEDRASAEIVVTGSGHAGQVAVRTQETSVGFELLETIDTYLSINDAGQFAFAANGDGFDDADELIVKFDGSQFIVVAREGDPVPADPTVNYSSQMKTASIQQDGAVSFDADTDGATETDQILLSNDGHGIIAREGIHIPANQAGGTTHAWSFFTGPALPDDNADNDVFQVDDTGENWIVRGNHEGDTTTDNIAAFNNVIFAQEGVALPGFTSPIPADTSVFRHYLSRRGGHFAARGDNADGTDWIMIDGQVVTWTGQPTYSGSEEIWFEAVARTHQVAVVNNDGDYVIGGFSDAPGAENCIAVLNNEVEIYREGQPIALDADGLFNDNVFFWSFQDNDAFLTEDGWFYFVADLKDGHGNVGVGQVFARLPVDLGAPPPCPCELDDAAVVDVFDLLAYLDLWFASDEAADLDGESGIDVFDLLAFLDCWFPASAGAPCP